MKNDNELLAAMPVRKAFFRLALPAVAAQLINILYNLVDKMFIGHIPGVGKQALAGVGVTAPVILAISAFAALVSMGGAPKASIFMGKGDNEQAEKVMGSCASPPNSHSHYLIQTKSSQRQPGKRTNTLYLWPRSYETVVKC